MIPEEKEEMRTFYQKRQPPWEGDGGGGEEGNVWKRCFQEGGVRLK